jgi:hypothetical protein
MDVDVDACIDVVTSNIDVKREVDEWNELAPTESKAAVMFSTGEKKVTGDIDG